ncbi:hypothetical protein LTR66_004864 [Elasticomyces elasticus]|nr:hypothetical protein LTR66_004864 [Elasticomyces elasticus]
MPDQIEEFPDISKKLTAEPIRKSEWHKEQERVAAKKAREDAEYDKILTAFEESFDEPEEGVANKSGSSEGHGVSAPSGPRGAGLGSQRRSGPGSLGPVPTGPRSGPGSLGPVPGAPARNSGPGTLGPASTSMSRQRAHDGPYAQSRDSRPQGMYAFDDAPSDPHSTATDDKDGGKREAEHEASKPSLYLSGLPPKSSVAYVKTLLPDSLRVTHVNLIFPSWPGATNHQSMFATVTLAPDTPAADIDGAVNTLHGKYLGSGYRLRIARQPSLSDGGTNFGVNTVADPEFGAREVVLQNGSTLRNAPPPDSQRGYAPPTSYTTTAPGQTQHSETQLMVFVVPPTTLAEVRMINMTISNVLEHGPEFEALLMAQPSVQRDEDFAWLFDSRSPNGVWYRWHLWEIATGREFVSDEERKGRPAELVRLFDVGPMWMPPDRALRPQFEFAETLEDILEDPDYNSSDYDSDDDGDTNMVRGQTIIESVEGEKKERLYLGPLRKAKLIYFLARLPTTMAALRRVDLAPITYFAIKHAGIAAEEIVHIMVDNIELPVSGTAAAQFPANPSTDGDTDDDSDDESMDDDDDASEELPTNPPTDLPMDLPEHGPAVETQPIDQAGARLVALYAISDIIGSSATSGVRFAWRYRQLFEAAFKQRRIFEKLGRLEKKLEWGKLTAEKWKRQVASLLQEWSATSMFPRDVLESFERAFLNPLSIEDEKKEAAKVERDKKAKEMAEGKKAIRNIGRSGEQETIQNERETHAEPKGQVKNRAEMQMTTPAAQPGAAGPRFSGKNWVKNVATTSAASGEMATPSQQTGIKLKMSLGGPSTDNKLSEPAARSRSKIEDMFADSDDE